MTSPSPIMSTIWLSNGVIVGVCMASCCNGWKINNSPRGTVLLHLLCFKSSSIYVSIHPPNIHFTHIPTWRCTKNPMSRWHSRSPQGDIPTLPSISKSRLLLGKFPFSRCHGNCLVIPDCSSRRVFPHPRRHTHTHAHMQLYSHHNVIWFNQSARQAFTLIWHVILSVNSPQSGSKFSV